MSLVEELMNIYLNPDNWTDKNFEKAKRILETLLKFQMQQVYRLLVEKPLNYKRLEKFIKLMSILNETKKEMLDEGNS
ncbi:MAG: hypothetical protein DRH57_00030 [Candidatus Cloacimonadota bacterium]|nr:MAG: hypothetical protein DRH57_00030 [Candidatus Cloacimonadota bacterium]